MFIFAFSLVFGLIVEGVGEDVFADLLGSMGFFQPVVAALVGLIPQLRRQRAADPALCGRCPPLFQSGGGLCTGAGVAWRLLAWRTNPLLEAEPLHHRPDMGRRRIPRRGIQVVVAIFRDHEKKPFRNPNGVFCETK